MVSVLIGVIYYKQTLTEDGVMNINGALFVFLTNMTFQNMFAVINVSVRTSSSAVLVHCVVSRCSAWRYRYS